MCDIISCSMDFFLEHLNPYRAQYDSAVRYYSYAQNYGYPVASKLSDLAQRSLFTHPDLTSVALLLVILYISFVFLVKAWRLTIGMTCRYSGTLLIHEGTIMLAVKVIVLALLAACVFGAYNGVVNGDTSLLRGLVATFQVMLRLIGDVIIGGNTSKEPARKISK